MSVAEPYIYYPGKLWSASYSKAKAPIAVTLLLLCYLVPQEIALNIGSLRLYSIRLILLLLFFPALIRYLRDPSIKLKSFDLILLLFHGWFLFAFSQIHGFERSLEFVGSETVDGMGAYLVGRAYVRTPEQFVGTVKLLFLVMLCAGGMALADIVTGRSFVHDIAQKITGSPSFATDQTRFGLKRAEASFDHPILYGVFCATSMGLIWYLARNSAERVYKLSALIFFTFLSFSSAPLLSIICQFGIMGWDRVTRFLKGRYFLTLFALFLLYIIVDIFSEGAPIDIFLGYLTLNPSTGYWRLLILDYGLESVYNNPIFGIGLNDWKRPSWMHHASVDNFWLVLAIRGGIPLFVFLAFMSLVLVIRVNRSVPYDAPQVIKAIVKGWNVTFLALCLVTLTVHLWGALYAQFFLLMGMIAFLTELPWHQYRADYANAHRQDLPR